MAFYIVVGLILFILSSCVPAKENESNGEGCPSADYYMSLDPPIIVFSYMNRVVIYYDGRKASEFKCAKKFILELILKSENNNSTFLEFPLTTTSYSLTLSEEGQKMVVGLAVEGKDSALLYRYLLITPTFKNLWKTYVTVVHNSLGVKTDWLDYQDNEGNVYFWAFYLDNFSRVSSGTNWRKFYFAGMIPPEMGSGACWLGDSGYIYCKINGNAYGFENSENFEGDFIDFYQYAFLPSWDSEESSVYLLGVTQDKMLVGYRWVYQRDLFYKFTYPYKVSDITVYYPGRYFSLSPRGVRNEKPISVKNSPYYLFITGSTEYYANWVSGFLGNVRSRKLGEKAEFRKLVEVVGGDENTMDDICYVGVDRVVRCPFLNISVQVPDLPEDGKVCLYHSLSDRAKYAVEYINSGGELVYRIFEVPGGVDLIVRITFNGSQGDGFAKKVCGVPRALLKSGGVIDGVFLNGWNLLYEEELFSEKIGPTERNYVCEAGFGIGPDALGSNGVFGLSCTDSVNEEGFFTGLYGNAPFGSDKPEKVEFNITITK